MEDYQAPMKFKTLDFSRFQKPAKPVKQTWSGVEVADYFKQYFDIPDTGAFGYSSWLRRIKKEKVSLDQAKRIIEIMLGVEAWLLKDKGEKLHRGKWMFNRFRFEIKEKGVDKFIASKS